MPEALARSNPVATRLLELLDLRKSLPLVTRPDDLPFGADLEDPARSRHERHLAELGLERGQELLRHPGRPQQPTTLRAVLDFHPGLHLIGSPPTAGPQPRPDHFTSPLAAKALPTSPCHGLRPAHTVATCPSRSAWQDGTPPHPDQNRLQ